MRLSLIGVVLGLVLLGGALLSLAFREPLPLTLWLGGVGLVVTAGSLFERVVYKPLAQKPLGPDWQATPERFRDPESGRLVQVYVKPATGERAYVGIDPPQATPRG